MCQLKSLKKTHCAVFIAVVFCFITKPIHAAEKSWTSWLNPMNWTVPADPLPKPKLPTPNLTKVKRTASTTWRKSTAPVKSAWRSTTNTAKSTAKKTADLFKPAPPPPKVETVSDFLSLPRVKW